MFPVKCRAALFRPPLEGAGHLLPSDEPPRSASADWNAPPSHAEAAHVYERRPLITSRGYRAELEIAQHGRPKSGRRGCKLEAVSEWRRLHSDYQLQLAASDTFAHTLGHTYTHTSSGTTSLDISLAENTFYSKRTHSIVREHIL